MNSNQKNILIGTGAIILVMLIFPPYHVVAGGGRQISAGFAFILGGPSNSYAVVNIGQLAVQWIGVAVAGSIAFFCAKN